MCWGIGVVHCCYESPKFNAENGVSNTGNASLSFSSTYLGKESET